MEVYLDLAILLNFLVDFLLLCGSSKLCGLPLRAGRLALSAALGAAYAGLCLVGIYDLPLDLPGHLLCLLAMAVLAFGADWKALRPTAVFFLLSMALGGLAMGFGQKNLWTVVLAAAVLWALCQLGLGGHEGTYCVPVSMIYQGKKIRLTALLDTGNDLRDPLTGRPVLVAGEETAGKLLGLTPQQLGDPLKTMTEGSCKGLRLIPYNAIGVSGGFLLAIQPEQLILDGKQVRHLVAFAPNKIGQGKAYEALAGGCV